MTPWTNRSPEERALLNPSFFSLLFWHAATGHMAEGGAGLPFGTGFLVLPIVLHRETRESLPKMVTIAELQSEIAALKLRLGQPRAEAKRAPVVHLVMPGETVPG